MIGFLRHEEQQIVVVILLRINGRHPGQTFQIDNLEFYCLIYLFRSSKVDSARREDPHSSGNVLYNNRSFKSYDSMDNYNDQFGTPRSAVNKSYF